MSSQRKPRRRLLAGDATPLTPITSLAWFWIALTAVALAVWANSSEVTGSENRQRQQQQNALDRPSVEFHSSEVEAASEAAMAASVHTRSGAALSLSKRGLQNAQRAGIHGLFRPTSAKELDLLGVILASTIEGGLYGIDRASGDVLWTLSQPRTSSAAGSPAAGTASSAAFEPLVSAAYGERGTSFASLAADGDRGLGRSAEQFRELQETGIYIVEPSSAGEIYVLTAERPSLREEYAEPSQMKTHLTKLPLTLPQLVDLSPFSFPGDDSRVFVGKKRVRLVELDITSGRVGAIFGGEEGVWCGSNADGSPSSKQDACGEEVFEGESAEEANWVYIGRTDYSLTIHARSRPHLTQTLRFSTFSANAADRDISTLWAQAGAASRSDHRSFLSTPDQGGLICLNSTRQQEDGGSLEAAALWNCKVEGTIAGIFDVVQPMATARRFTPSGSIKQAAASVRPIIVPHSPVTVSTLLGKAVVPQSTSATSEEPPPKASVPAHIQTYLGISDGSLYVMSSRNYPLSTFSAAAAAAAALPGSLPKASPPIASHSSMQQLYNGLQQPVPNHHTCTSYRCWLGSYTVGVDTTAEGLLRASLQGQPHYMSIDDGGRPLLGIGDGGHSVSPQLSSSNDSKPETANPASLPVPTPADASSPYFVAGLQILGVTFAALLGAIMYLGLQEQKRQTQATASYLAQEIEWVASEGEHQSLSEGEGLESAMLPPLTKAAESIFHARAYSRPPELKARQTAQADGIPPNPEAQQSWPSTPPVPIRTEQEANAVAEALLQEEMDIAKMPTDEKKDSAAAAKKRRRRGKRAGAAVIAKNQDHDASPKSHSKNDSSSISVLDINDMETQDVHSSSDPTNLRGIVPPAVSLPQGLQNASLEISDHVLGYGSSGTVVFKGTFQGRAVAVKRLLRDFVNVASKEVSLLESADNHPNVIRYFYKELTGSFLFIALELCPASLADIVEKTTEYRELGNLLEPKKALRQITSGLQHLHSLSIVHRDIKPQNILVSVNAAGQLKMLLSDFGLSKRLDGLAQTSFSQTINNPGGTVGWRAPELLRGEVSLESSDESSASSAFINGAPSGLEERKRLTRAVDIFSLGCVAYYILSNGDHPFGGRFEREMNIVQRRIRLPYLDGLGEEGHEAQHLIMAMIDSDPTKRPSPTDILIHPYFWNSARRLAFLQDASDRFEVMETDPPHPALIALECDAVSIVDRSWQKKMDKMFVDDLGKFRTYGNGVQDLLRALRNKKHHFQDLPAALRRKMEPLPDGFLAYFTTKFPLLFLRVYMVVANDPLLRAEFATYFTIASD